jgi:hypothetical protein
MRIEYIPSFHTLKEFPLSRGFSPDDVVIELQKPLKSLVIKEALNNCLSGTDPKLSRIRIQYRFFRTHELPLPLRIHKCDDPIKDLRL